MIKKTQAWKKDCEMQSFFDTEIYIMLCQCSSDF